MVQEDEVHSINERVLVPHLHVLAGRDGKGTGKEGNMWKDSGRRQWSEGEGMVEQCARKDEMGSAFAWEDRNGDERD